MEFYLSLKDGEYGRCVINYNLKTGGSTLFKPLVQQSWMKGYGMKQCSRSLLIYRSSNKRHSYALWKLCNRPTTTPLIAEAMALLLAVQQLHAFDYKNVVFLGDCMELFNNLDSSSQQGTCNMKKICEANSIIQDILHSANKRGFKFHYISRSLSNVADVLAKNARIRNQGYVISRPNF
ncbi:hypothetical protein IGI04_015125 [Brassica rapa subsp. trilocularis]|uniref:RNase H type-1 domain-containing protein n=1 Tax=Brassica rapa subsp. trilocularis TaxID=1813537 RepID=A0ABQ7MP54_BRACM|nr:hypothetical protein IGI04_015125 [Brassica rapa subsp. trilocularis]